MTISVAQAQIFFLVFTRMMAVIISIPNLGGQTIPNQVRIALGIILTVVLVPWSPMSSSAESLRILPFSVAILQELIIGTLIGFAAILTFGAVSVAGETMGLGSGFSSDRIFNPAMEQSVTPMGQLFTVVAMLLFIILNGHHVALVALQRSFTVVPVNAALPTFSAEILLRTTAQLIVVGIQMAFPIFAALLLTDITLGLLSRVAPQVQVYFLGLPLKIGISMFALGLTLSIMFPILRDLFNRLGDRMLGMIAQ